MLPIAADTDSKKIGSSESRFPQYFIAFIKEATKKHMWYEMHSSRKIMLNCLKLILAKDTLFLTCAMGQWYIHTPADTVYVSLEELKQYIHN